LKSLGQPQAPKYRYPHPHGRTGAGPDFRMYRNSQMSVAALLPARAFSHPARVSTPPPVVPSQAHRLHLHPPFRSTLAGWLACLACLAVDIMAPASLVVAGHGHTRTGRRLYQNLLLPPLLLARMLCMYLLATEKVFLNTSGAFQSLYRYSLNCRRKVPTQYSVLHSLLGLG
jgi:hypothetical protein